MNTCLDEEVLNAITDHIASEGFAIVDHFLPETLVEGLSKILENKYKSGAFHEAGIGKSTYHVAKDTRGDHVLWIEENTVDLFEIEYLARVASFVEHLNRSCYLGIRTTEFHYAKYPIGTHYNRHLDRFQSDSRRKMSMICYLNKDWVLADGGELALYLTENGVETEKRISPIAGRMVCFESDVLEHEVLLTNKERNSITGWLKTA